MLAFHNDQYALTLPPGHRFPMDKYRLLREALQAAGPELSELRLQPCEPASPGELALAHAPAYIAAVFDGSLSPALLREIGFPWSPGMAERARRSVGGTICAARAALREGIAGSLGGGTHHASADRGGGYCVFNDIAVAARLMQAEHHRSQPARPLRVAVIDLDVHQGNGTAAIFAGDASVFTLSLHGARNFPFRKVAGDLDVELPDGCDDAAYLAALDAALDELWRRHGDDPPGLIFYQAGVDVHVHDRLGRLALSDQGVAERDARVLTAALERGIPLVLTMGGGYGQDIHTTVALQVQTWRLAHAAWWRWAHLRAGGTRAAGPGASTPAGARE
jgi:acetoin utilization deacetylase AcuC-like enzyme